MALDDLDKKKFVPFVVEHNGSLKIELIDNLFSSAPDPEFAISLFKNKKLIIHSGYQKNRNFYIKQVCFDSIMVSLKNGLGSVLAETFYDYHVCKNPSKFKLNSDIKYFPQDFPIDHSINFVGDDRLNVSTFKYGELLSLDIKEDFDWKFEFDKNLHSNRMWLCALDFIGRLLSYYEYSSDPRAILFARHFLNSFIEFSNTSNNKEFISGIPSQDHSTTVRLNVMVKYLSIAWKVLPTTERDKVLNEIIYWADWLYAPDYFHETNHGTMSSIALMVTSCFFTDSEELKVKYLNRATERLYLIANKSLCPDGLSYENTIGYHNYNIQLYKKSTEFAKLHDLWNESLGQLQSLIEKAEIALRFALRQDNTIPPIGDSPVYNTNYESINESKCFKQSGFAIIKDDVRYLSVQCGSRSEHHKQMDDSSITYRLGGKDIIIDAGSYTYDRQTGLGRFVESACGHSGIFPRSFDNKRRREVIRQRKGIYGEIRGLHHGVGISYLECAYYTGDHQFFAERIVYSTDDEDLIVVDSATLASADSTNNIVARYNIGPEYYVTEHGNAAFKLKSENSNLNVYVLSGNRAELFHGYESDGHFKGWHSVDFGVIKKNFTIELISDESVAVFLVVFTKKDIVSFRESISKYANLFPAALNSALYHKEIF
ncbi:heparinase II/III family protein [Aeromonas hydrophila]|uniref:heparinase II/III domain-containing protein n=1 Tax=Aeromonas TaxID=642 RepID=UPI0030058AC7